jgi:hypothetical protein
MSVASSADGTKLVAASSADPTLSLGHIYLSSDSGASWTETGTPQNWKAVALSADGTKVVAVVEGGYIYTWNDPLP